MAWRTRIEPEAAISFVRACVVNGWPASVIRLGDGDTPLIGWPTHRDIAGITHTIKYALGRIPVTLPDVDAMMAEFQPAITNADIVGVPDEAHCRKKLLWSNIEVYLKEFDLVAPRTLLVDSNLHITAYRDGLLKELLDGLDSVTLLGCRDVVDIVSRGSGIKDVRWIRVPVEAQTNQNIPTNHWPDRFEELREGLVVPKPGHLFLVGAGFLGRVYCSWIKDRGGVGLDIGSIMDVFAGVKSRSYQRPEESGF